MTHHILLLPGDGIGPEVLDQTIRVLDAATAGTTVQLSYETALIGGAAIDAWGTPLRDEEIRRAEAADAVLLGAVGGPKWDDPTARVRPEQGLLRLRKALGLFANLRPVAANPALLDVSPLKNDRVRGTDLLVVRELTGGLYFGRPQKQWTERRGRVAVDTLLYREHEIRRVVTLACQLARGRRSHLTSVDKANVIETSRLWRRIATEVAADYPDVTLDHQLVDSMAMKLVQSPARYDVIVTENMFGDILTDEASVLSGSIGLLPSASLGAIRPNGTRVGLYEPIHGSAPDIAGQGIANPAGTILSAAMMLRLSLGQPEIAARIESAVNAAIVRGVRTADLGGQASTAQFTETVIAQLTA